MFYEEPDTFYMADMSGTSEGTQIKYYKDGYWYKQDFYVRGHNREPDSIQYVIGF